MIRFLILIAVFWVTSGQGATIAIIDTGFDLDHEFLRPKILKQETDEETIDPALSKQFHGWSFHDNSHLKKAVIEDSSALQEILLFRNLRAKGHREGLSPEEFEWFRNKNSDKAFMEKVRMFKKHAHGTFVAGIALREGKNINIFPIRGLNIPIPVVAVEDSTTEPTQPITARNPEVRFQQEIKNSLDRVSRKFSKICHYLSLKKIEVVNASYGITYKNILTKFREMHLEITGKEIEEPVLMNEINKYFEELYRRSTKTIKRYPRMLFIFSAGNSGLDNDTYHHYPSRIKLPNTISVAAMNGEYLASFSNYGPSKVDIGAPGVAILSLVPKVYSQDGDDIYSPSSGTSMAAPYISNLAAQIINANVKLTAADVKRIILETGEEKEHLKPKLVSGSMVNNRRAIKASLLSLEMPLDEAINLARLDIVPIEDKISIGMAPAVAAESIQKKAMESIPQVITPAEVNDETLTKASSSSPLDPEKEQPDNSVPPASALPDAPVVSADPVPSSQIEEQSPKPSEDLPASSSPPELKLPEVQSLETSPSLPQS
jgi:subtilisin family serine protease